MSELSSVSLSSNSSTSTLPYTSSSSLNENPNLPAYTHFRENLCYLNPAKLDPEDSCPICQDRYLESAQSVGNIVDLPTLDSLHALPYSKKYMDSPLDRPVRLPCAAGHVVGDACMQHWFLNAGSNTCPIDRQPLFRIEAGDLSGGDGERRSMRFLIDEYREGRRRIERYPLRKVLKMQREQEKKIIIQPVDMCRRLATVMIQTAVNLERPRLPPDHVELVWRKSAPSDRRRKGLPRLRMDVWTLRGKQESVEFRKLIRSFGEGVELKNGVYPQYLQVLLDPAVADMFCILYRMARVLQGEVFYDSTTLSQKFVNKVTVWWIPSGVTDERLLLFLMLVVEAWVSQEGLMTEWREETGELEGWQCLFKIAEEHVMRDFDIVGEDDVHHDVGSSGEDDEIWPEDSVSQDGLDDLDLESEV